MLNIYQNRRVTGINKFAWDISPRECIILYTIPGNESVNNYRTQKKVFLFFFLDNASYHEPWLVFNQYLPFFFFFNSLHI